MSAAVLARRAWSAVRCALVLAAWALVACAAHAADTRAVETKSILPGGVLGTGDIVRITVFQQPDMTTEARVSDAGTITFPLVGVVSVRGLTLAQAETLIADGLRRGNFMNDPQINVYLLQARSRQVAVLGQVVRPGKYPMEESTVRLTDVLSLAGGSNGSDTVTLVRNNGAGQPVKMEIDVPQMFLEKDMSKNIEMLNGDIVYVQRAPMFYIYGEVARPGAYRLERKMTVLQALALAGGLTPRGTERDVRIHRRNAADVVERITVEMTDPVRQDDVVYIRQSLF